MTTFERNMGVANERTAETLMNGMPRGEIVDKVNAALIESEQKKFADKDYDTIIAKADELLRSPRNDVASIDEAILRATIIQLRAIEPTETHYIKETDGQLVAIATSDDAIAVARKYALSKDRAV